MGLTAAKALLSPASNIIRSTVGQAVPFSNRSHIIIVPEWVEEICRSLGRPLGLLVLDHSFRVLDHYKNDACDGANGGVGVGRECSGTCSSQGLESYQSEAYVCDNRMYKLISRVESFLKLPVWEFCRSIIDDLLGMEAYSKMAVALC